MLKSHGQVTLVDVVRPYPYPYELLYKILHNVYTVVYAGEQYTLIAERNTCVCKPCACRRGLLCNLIGMVEVRVEPNGMILLEHIAKFGSDPLGHNDGCSRTYADYLHMGYCAQ